MKASTESALSLDNTRSVLARLEETIIFALIERAQFCRNDIIYQPNGAGVQLQGESLMGFLLRESERTHALVRRYSSPDEHAFYPDLPAPILPVLRFDNPLHPAAAQININERVRQVYEQDIVPAFCRAGDDSQWGSSAVCDVILLQVLSKRIHYGKFVAEAKFIRNPERFESLIQSGDESGLALAVTDERVEEQVLHRVHRKAEGYARELDAWGASFVVDPAAVRLIYSRWVIPMNKEVQVRYLLLRRSGG
jgi:chorismate mutase